MAEGDQKYVYGGPLTPEERVRSESTLLCLIQACKGYTTTVDLRNESSVLGRIEHVDGHMNLRMMDVTFSKINGEKEKHPQMFIQGQNIRFVHIPDEIDMRQAIKKELNKFENARNFQRRAPPRKKKIRK